MIIFVLTLHWKHTGVCLVEDRENERQIVSYSMKYILIDIPMGTTE